MIKPPVMMLVSRVLFVRMMFLGPEAAPAGIAMLTMTVPCAVNPEDAIVMLGSLSATIEVELTPVPLIHSNRLTPFGTTTLAPPMLAELSVVRLMPRALAFRGTTDGAT